MSPDQTVLFSPTRRYRPYLAALREIGFDVTPSLATLGLTEAQLLDPETRVPRDQAVRWFQSTLEAVNRPDIGLMAAERFEPSDFGVLGYLLRHAEHPLAALRYLTRFARLLADTAEGEVVVADGEVCATLGMSGGRAFFPEGADFAAGVFVRLIGQLSGGAPPRSVWLPRPAPLDAMPYRRLFGGGVRFAPEQRAIVLRYEQRALTSLSPESDALLSKFLEQHAEGVLARLPALGRFGEQLRSVLDGQLERGDTGIERAASALGMSERTLRRKLASLGRSYRELLDEVRRDRALALLSRGEHSIAEIAQRIGFGDATAFTRSFRRWTGQTPSQQVRERVARAR